jgi:hypothetical protein
MLFRATGIDRHLFNIETLHFFIKSLAVLHEAGVERDPARDLVIVPADRLDRGDVSLVLR